MAARRARAALCVAAVALAAVGGAAALGEGVEDLVEELVEVEEIPMDVCEAVRAQCSAECIAAGAIAAQATCVTGEDGQLVSAECSCPGAAQAVVDISFDDSGVDVTVVSDSEEDALGAMLDVGMLLDLVLPRPVYRPFVPGTKKSGCHEGRDGDADMVIPEVPPMGIFDLLFGGEQDAAAARMEGLRAQMPDLGVRDFEVPPWEEPPWTAREFDPRFDGPHPRHPDGPRGPHRHPPACFLAFVAVSLLTFCSLAYCACKHVRRTTPQPLPPVAAASAYEPLLDVDDAVESVSVNPLHAGIATPEQLAEINTAPMVPEGVNPLYRAA